MTSREQKIAQLKEAIAGFRSGQFDREAEEAKAAVRRRALGLLDVRARSRQELRERLIEAEFEPVVVDDVLDDLAAVNLIDDAAFAREWVRQRHARRGKSTRVLEQELRQKGIDSATRAEALDQIDAADEEATARALAEKKARTIREAPADRAETDKALRRIVGVLARRGFPQGMSLRIAREALEERIAGLG
ncbi:recombination regulator RecX [Corynebacterium sp. YIM 101645]|uniref:Regulatory protein RecX n=1 Tax=Corynebacterium lemuris TaxID=1859292 RepID=A0ABT2FVA9_9CORY|nr:recombination regulator RecX [Corynebacterium lemuris]MCS5479176.1 recombination regulator RecX [Corynebacterium lemuris]